VFINYTSLSRHNTAIQRRKQYDTETEQTNNNNEMTIGLVTVTHNMAI